MSVSSNGRGEIDRSDNETPGTDAGDARALERKAEALRREVDQLIADAERRRHGPIARQIKRHPVLTAVIGGAVGAGLAALGVMLVRRYRGRGLFASDHVPYWLTQKGGRHGHW